MTKTLLLLPCLLVPTLVMATEVEPSGPEWGRASLGLKTMDIGQDTYDGLVVDVKVPLDEHVYFTASHFTVSNDFGDRYGTLTVDYSETAIGLGSRFAVTDSTDIFVDAAYLLTEAEGTYSTSYSSYWTIEDGSGFQVGAGIAAELSPKLDLTARYGYVEVDGIADHIGSVKGMYKVSNMFGIEMGYTRQDEVDGAEISAVIFF